MCVGVIEMEEAVMDVLVVGYCIWSWAFNREEEVVVVEGGGEK